jgi:DNA-nicking Smr family endonuclease
MAQPAEPPEDDALFEEAMEGVRRIDPVHRPPEPVFRPTAGISEREREVLRELDELVAGAGELVLQDPDDLIEARVPGLDPRVLRRLAAGEFTVQADLDLHGCDAATARGLVESFILAAHARGLRCLRIIHGRGRGSPGGVPVLKAQMPRWLARGPARQLVLAYTSATARDGGAGATYVLLRRRRR